MHGNTGKNENNLHFIYREFSFFCKRSELKYHENFHEESYGILLFVLETSVIVLTIFGKSIYSRMVQKPKTTAKY